MHFANIVYTSDWIEPQILQLKMILSHFCFPSFFVVLLKVYVWHFELICHEIQKNCHGLYNITFKLILMTTIH